VTAAAMGPCISFFQSLLLSSSSVQSKAQKRLVLLSNSQKGAEVVTSAWQVKGSGVALATSAVEQDRAYFEAIVRKLDNAQAAFAVGVARQSDEPDKAFAGTLGSCGEPGWGLSSARVECKAGDVVGVYIDQSSVPRLSFSLNGQPLGPQFDVPGSKQDEPIRGQIYPAVHVKNCALELVFDEGMLKHLAPNDAFKPIIVVRDML
jgi:hypothetical protein